MTADKALNNINKLKHKFIASEVDGELILIHGDSGEFFAISDVGLEIWRLLDEERDIAAIIERLVSCYNISRAECERDVRGFTDDLVDVGFAEAA